MSRTDQPDAPGASGGQEFAGLGTAQLLTLDRLCRDYEQALGGDAPVAIEDVLAAADGVPAPVLFRELFYQYVADKQRRHERLDRAACRARFPQYARQVDDVWDSLNPVSVAGDVPAGLAIPGYAIVARLARGGMGVVYRARDLTLDREVAIKMLSFDRITRDETARFLVEAKALGALHHPHVIQVHGAGEHFGQPYLVLEYAAGGSLQDRLDRGPFPPGEILDVMLPLAEAIAFIHDSGKLHRDLKPSNILFTADGTPKISDFGLAKDLMAATELTLTQTQLGTPAGMAPEQADARFGKVGVRSDIFSLGVLLHTLLTGVTPYHGMTSAQLLKALTSADPVPATHLRRLKIGAGWRRICLRCLAKRPQHRYPTAAALLADLRRLRTGAAVSALPLWRRFTGTARRGVTLVALLLIGAGGLWLAERRESGSAAEIVGFAGGRVIATLAPEVLAALNQPYTGPEEFRVVTLAGAGVPDLASPRGLALYRDRWLAVADTLNHRVLVIDLVGGEVTLVAGSGQAAYSGDGQAALLANLNLPGGLDFDAAGNLLIADRGNHAVRQVDPAGVITTTFGGAGCEYASGNDGRLLVNTVCYPADVSAASAADLYVADSYNLRIQHKRALQHHSTVAVLGGAQDAAAGFTPMPRAMTYDRGELYFIAGKNGRLQRLAADGEMLTVAGGFREPADIGVDGAGTLYVSDTAGWPLSRVDPATGEVMVLAPRVLGETRRVGALALDRREEVPGRVFFTDLADSSVNVIIAKAGSLPFEPFRAFTGDRDYPPPPRLHDNARFSYIDTPLKEMVADMAYRLGLHPYIEGSLDLSDRINVSFESMSTHDVLVFGCFAFAVACAIDGDSLVVAPPGELAGFTAAAPLQIGNPLAYIDNWQSMPADLQAEAGRSVVLEAGGKRVRDEFFHMLEGLGRIRFDIDPGMADYKEAMVDFQGEKRIGDLLAVLVLWRKINLSYDAASGKVVVSRWREDPSLPVPGK
jgi:hypothetical protein